MFKAFCEQPGRNERFQSGAGGVVTSARSSPDQFFLSTQLRPFTHSPTRHNNHNSLIHHSPPLPISPPPLRASLNLTHPPPYSLHPTPHSPLSNSTSNLFSHNRPLYQAKYLPRHSKDYFVLQNHPEACIQYAIQSTLHFHS